MYMKTYTDANSYYDRRIRRLGPLRAHECSSLFRLTEEEEEECPEEEEEEGKRLLPSKEEGHLREEEERHLGAGLLLRTHPTGTASATEKVR